MPQIVTERLKAAAPVVEHPDADLLTAFSERSLSRADRNSVLEHLARCVECREIIALALPASEPVQQIVRPAHDGWLTWPVLRWGLIAAGVVAITSFGVMRYQRHSQMTAYNAPRSEAASKIDKPLATPSSEPAENKLQTPAPSAPAGQSDLVSSNAGPISALTAPSLTRRVQSKGGQIAGTLPSGPRVQWQQNASNQQQAQMQSLPSQSIQVRDQQVSANTTASATSQDMDTSAQAGVSSNMGTPVLESQRIEQPLQADHADSRIERIKPAGTSTTSASKAALAPDFPSPDGAVGGTMGRKSQYTVSSSPTNWTISSTGGLQRSFDQGSTWQNVDVNNSPAASNLALMKAPSRAKELTNEQVANGGSLANDKENSANESVTKNASAKKDAAALVFRAVASNGPDVWAGAAGGLLYHSSDAGGHWTRVVPAAAGVSLTGDIVSLEFMDPQHGRVVTSIPETWTTSDAGQSWQKQ